MNFFVIMPTNSNVQYCSETRSWVRKSKSTNCPDKDNGGESSIEQGKNSKQDQNIKNIDNLA